MRQLGDLIVSEYHTKTTTPTVFILFFAGGWRSCGDWWRQWWHHIARDVSDVGSKRGKCPDAVSVLLGDKFLNLCNHLDHVRSSGATNHDLKIIPGQVTMHVDFSVHWLTLLLEQIICKRTKKSAITWKRLCSIMWKLEINQLQEASLLDFWQLVHSLRIQRMIVREAYATAVSMDEKVLGCFVSASLLSRPNKRVVQHSMPDFERKTDS